MPGVHTRRVSPFGYPRITACQPLPEAFRRLATSFIACLRQGIHTHALSSLTIKFAVDTDRHGATRPHSFLAGGVVVCCPSIFNFQRSGCLITQQSEETFRYPACFSWSLRPCVVGLGRVELPTSPLSGVRSSHLSYRPVCLLRLVELIGIEPTAS